MPLALCLMEAQPLAMALAFLAVLFGGTPASAPLGVGEIALLLLGLLWWAMALAYFQTRGRIRSPQAMTFLRLCGLFVAWGILGLSQLPHLADLGLDLRVSCSLARRSSRSGSGGVDSRVRAWASPMNRSRPHLKWD